MVEKHHSNRNTCPPSWHHLQHQSTLQLLTSERVKATELQEGNSSHLEVTNVDHIRLFFVRSFIRCWLLMIQRRDSDPYGVDYSFFGDEAPAPYHAPNATSSTPYKRTTFNEVSSSFPPSINNIRVHAVSHRYNQSHQHTPASTITLRAALKRCLYGWKQISTDLSFASTDLTYKIKVE